MRIRNVEMLTAHGNREGRRDIVAIMEAGLSAADPYAHTRRVFRVEGKTLQIGDPLYEADGDPRTGVDAYDLDAFRAIYVVGAGKGVQRVAKAIEDALGERLTGGCVIAKHGDAPILRKVRVIFGAHPVPDEGCVAGCRMILELAKEVTSEDLVITIIGNGGSSLLTLPEEGISLSDVKGLTTLMQIEKGVTTVELNVVRNHIDQLKGGKLSRLFRQAKCVHLIITDANHHVIQDPRHDYEGLMRGNVWLHNLPEGSTFAQALAVLRKYDALERCPRPILDFLAKADPAHETVKYDEFSGNDFRVFGIMPDSEHFLPAARGKAEALGYRTAVLTQLLQAEASQSARVLSAIATNVQEFGEPFMAPVALFSSGEMLVTVEKSLGVGGRNQEFALACARQISGSRRIVIGSCDSDGTDGPGGLAIPGAPGCLGGAVVDGYTLERARAMEVDVNAALRSHDTSAALWALGCGMDMEPNISLNDLTVLLIQP